MGVRNLLLRGKIEWKSIFVGVLVMVF
jgi:hypothetical protein